MFVHDLLGYLPIAAGLGGLVLPGSILFGLALAILVPLGVILVNAVGAKLRGVL